MNARGMVELILVNLGLQRGLITPTMFAMLVSWRSARRHDRSRLQLDLGTRGRAGRRPPAGRRPCAPGVSEIVARFAGLLRAHPKRLLVHQPGAASALSAADIWDAHRRYAEHLAQIGVGRGQTRRLGRGQLRRQRGLPARVPRARPPP